MGAAAIPVVASVAGTGLSMMSSISKGQGTQAADQYQAQQLEEQAQAAQVAATQTAATSTQRLQVTLGNLDAIRAASGDDPSSPTTAALRDRASYLSNEQMGIQVGNYLSQANEDQAGASYLNRAGSFALDAAFMGAGGTALSALSKLPGLPG